MTTLEFDGWTIDESRYEIHNPQGEIVPFTLREFKILTYLVQSAGKVQRRDVVNYVTNPSRRNSFGRSVDITVARIRKKLHDDSHTPRYIKTIRGIGYLFYPIVSTHL